MSAATVRMTMGEALARYLAAQRIDLDGAGAGHTEDPRPGAPLFPGVYAIFGHGNALGFGDALALLGDQLPTYRGQNEQGMALAAVAYAKAARRRQCMVVTTSIGPGALNVVTAAGVAMANRLPLLIISGDTFASRVPDPVLQQIEQFSAPSLTANDAFRPVVRYWDRITSPEQLLQSLPQAVGVLLDPAECGPVFLGLPQDVQAQAYDFPEALFRTVVHRIARPRPDRQAVAAAVEALRRAERPLIVAGGGVHYSLAEAELSAFAARHRIPVVETVAGKSSLVAADPAYAGPLGVLGAPATNQLAAEADVVLAIGTRLQDFTTASWTVFAEPDLRVIAVNAARFDALKHRCLPVVGDALESLAELSLGLGPWRGSEAWAARGGAAAAVLRREVAERCAIPVSSNGGDLESSQAADPVTGPTAGPTAGPGADSQAGAVLSYAQVVGIVHGVAGPHDVVLTASGGLPGELNTNWPAKGVATFDCEYGFSCMGYEMAGAWGAAMQLATRADGGTLFAMTGDGSYLMLNSELYSAVLNGDHLVLVVCDNGGFAVIERLQIGHGAASFRTMLAEPGRPIPPRVDFVAHAAALGCHAVRADDQKSLDGALRAAATLPGVHVIVVQTQEHVWTDSGAFWQVGVPEVSQRADVTAARVDLEDNKTRQRTVW
jgi:3D-(3,5/4)-trihydroxycyclohexane-1,2-dione acylhydrolase (decyclizing)